ncbi:hypothetical protein NADFUDRAFT_47705 [Nadsonia fulvescens var. elongata DSM 6958]|uniref:GET complex, subunit GET2 n=1 Tax=Nadsonia fulvescens var. elongata DSM 6958 TaxID=857566 RepID=A0A1E3PEW4_9ASCO|nr:hypothetical protein NADFUDRAFT_47705 [Nadsonia fulvescens var. elongata DSM 6958]
MDAKEMRERRQARIKASGAARLAKITGKQVPEQTTEDVVKAEGSTEFPQSTPEPFDNSSTFKMEIAEHMHDDPPIEEIESITNHGINTDPFSFENDPLFQMMKQQNIGGNNSDFNNVSETDGMAGFDDIFSQMLSGAGLPGMGAGFPGMGAGFPGMGAGFPGMGGAGFPGMSAQTGASSDTAIKVKWTKSKLFWSLIHPLLIIISVVYAGSIRSSIQSNGDLLVSSYRASPSFLIMLFVTIQLVLQGGKYIYTGGAAPSTSKLSWIAGFLPSPYNEYLNLGLRYFQMGTRVLNDFCLLVFLVSIWYV